MLFHRDNNHILHLSIVTKAYSERQVFTSRKMDGITKLESAIAERLTQTYQVIARSHKSKGHYFQPSFMEDLTEKMVLW